ncbi:hypothetical protein DRO66_02415 [Candidatus Bathyarchaeota archaeon]|nr:MAG: hypothetical protein DRO66_02415 [Candidatus Bathyarchaeota archaeon]
MNTKKKLAWALLLFMCSAIVASVGVFIYIERGLNFLLQFILGFSGVFLVSGGLAWSIVEINKKEVD